MISAGVCWASWVGFSTISDGEKMGRSDSGFLSWSIGLSSFVAQSSFGREEAAWTSRGSWTSSELKNGSKL